MNILIKVELFKNKKSVLKNNIRALYKENEYLVYKENNYENTIDLKNKCFFKRDNDTNFMIDFNNKKCKITLVENNKTFDITVHNCKMLINKKEISIKYNIESNSNEIELQIKLKGK